MKILVSGSAGFIGYFLTKRLLERGDEVVGVDNINDYYDTKLKYGRLNELGIDKDEIQCSNKAVSAKYKKHHFYRVDLCDKSSIDEIFEQHNFDSVVNLAAQAGVRYSLTNPDAYINSNVVGFLNILEACRGYGVDELVFASSSSVYGLNKATPFRTSDKSEHQVSLYAATKKSNEMMAHAYAHLYGIRCTGLRFFTVYGPWGRPDMAPFLFTQAIAQNRSINVFNHGDMSRDFTYIDDVIDAVIMSIDNPAKADANWDPKDPDISRSSAPYRLYNIGNSKPVDLMEFIRVIEKNLKKEAKKEFLPMQDGDVKSTYADVSGLVEDFGYRPKTKLEDGIGRFVSWYAEFYGLDL